MNDISNLGICCAQEKLALGNDIFSVDVSDLVGRVVFLDPRRIKPLLNNPRRKDNPGFSESSIKALAESIMAVGQNDPVKVYISNDPNFDVCLIDGERRLMACLSACIKIRAEIKEVPPDAGVLIAQAIASNFNREGHTCLEIAEAIHLLKVGHGLSVDKISSVIGKSVPAIYQYLNIFKLSPSVQKLLVTPTSDVADNNKKGRRKKAALSFILVSELCDLPHDEQEEIALKIVGGDLDLNKARREINNHRIKTGKPKGRNRPGDRFYSMMNLVQATDDKFGIFLDMTPDQLSILMSGQDVDKLSQFVKKIEFLESSLSSLREIAKTYIK